MSSAFLLLVEQRNAGRIATDEKGKWTQIKVRGKRSPQKTQEAQKTWD
jgi:hypothetical protein